MMLSYLANVLVWAQYNTVMNLLRVR